MHIIIWNTNLVTEFRVLCLRKIWTVLILNTYARNANSLIFKADVCNGLVYENVFISFIECMYKYFGTLYKILTLYSGNRVS